MLGGTYHLSSLWPPYETAVRDFLMPYCEYYGLQGTIVSGYRSLEEQAALYQKGRTYQEVVNRVRKQGRDGAVTDAAPGESAHNYGLAVDVEGRDQRQIVSLGQALGFGTVSWDPAHLEWPNWRSLLR